MEDFYFAYRYNKEKNNVSRLYRTIKSVFERYNKDTSSWELAPEQSYILIGEDWEYDEITEEEANKIIENM